jgi:hypothetical protein
LITACRSLADRALLVYTCADFPILQLPFSGAPLCDVLMVGTLDQIMDAQSRINSIFRTLNRT